MISALPSAAAAADPGHPADALEQVEAALAVARRDVPLVRLGGAITEIAATHYRISGLSRHLKLGDMVSFEIDGRDHIGQVVRIDRDGVTAKAFEPHAAASLGIIAYRAPPLSLAPHPGWKGRVINALGAPIDGRGLLRPGDAAVSVDADPPPAMGRSRVHQPLRTGVRVIDLFTPICAGQRIGIFAGSGLGKTTLLAMLARSASFDTVVTALVGERGREVREYLEDALVASRERSVTVVSTGDESPMMRRLAPKTAMAVAEYFRDRGDKVLLILDSVTRYAHAARDVALAAGEPAVARGYTPSVFSDLPHLLERAGPGVEGGGSITGFFAVLVDGDDHNEPVADAIRGTLDGHVVLDRVIADQGRYPAVNVLSSVSRVSQHVWTPEQRDLIANLRSMIARFEDTRDLRLMGGYHPGRDADLDQAVKFVPRIYDALRQTPDQSTGDDPFRELSEMLKSA
jgi:flagellum-specific ATP synthase